MIAGAIAFLALIVFGLGYYFLVPHHERVVPRPLTQSESWIQQKARETDGDYNKLSADDKQHMISQYGQSAPLQLRMTYQALKRRHG
jgi:hypothetical protein